jgi:hypothetical protein
MVFSRVGPNQSIEWGQIRVSKSVSAQVHRKLNVAHLRTPVTVLINTEAGASTKPRIYNGICCVLRLGRQKLLHS